MAKVLESLISKGRRARRPPEQKEVAFGLADLSTHEELLERMVQKGGIKSLLILLTKSIDTDAQRFAALALGNVGSAAFNRSRMASEGTIPIVIEYMKNTENDIVARQYCAMTLGNLAAEPENHMEIIKSEGVDALISVLKSEDIEGGRYAAFALANLAANANHRERIVEQGAVPCLVSLACCEDINAQRQAMAALRGVCISPEFRAVVVREGILDPIVLMSRSEDVGVLRDVASSLNNLSSVEENKMEVADRAMCTIIGLMLSGDNVVERHAVCAAANLMETIELNSRLIEERGVAPLVALASNEDANSRGEACRCLANLSVNPDVHQVLIREGALAALVGSLGSPELNCQRYAALSLANLATTVAAQVKIIQNGAIRPLIALGLNPMNQIEARRYAVLALANLTATTANHMTIIEDGGISALLSLCNSPDLMSQYYVGCALANLSCSLTNHPIIVEAGGVQAIIALASSPDPDVHQQAVAALRGLSVTFANKMKIVQEGAMAPLTHLLASDDVEILREVVATLANLSVSDENKYEIVKAGTVAALISLSQSTDMVVSSQSAAALANLAEVPANQDSIAREGAVRPTIMIMRSKYIEVQREAGRLLANLCASDSDFTNTIIESGGHNLLISYLLSNDTACQRVGSMGICNLCTKKRFREVLIECGVLEPLCSLARSEDVELEIQRYAVLAIANLASATENHKTFVEDGMLSMLISLSTANDAEVRQYAAYAVVKLAQNAEVRTVITEAGGLEPVLYLARTDEPEIQKQVLPALCCLSFHDANKVPIVRHGGLETVVRAIRDSSTDISRLACCTLANLAEMAINFDLISESGAIINLVMALNSPSEEVKRESARALGNLSANIELGDVILREGALPFLIPMLRSSEYLTQRMAAMALCNLSSNIRNQSYLLNNGLFDPLIHETELSLDPKSKSDNECARYCLLTLTNLAVNPNNQGMLMKYALPILSEFSKHRDIKCRQHAVFCIGNLCSNSENLEAIISTGTLRTIITYAFPSSDSSSNVQFQAVAALRGLATHPVLRVQIVRDGALEPLIIATKAPSIEVQREAAAAICNLAMSEENKISLARGGALPVLINLAMSNDEQRELHAVAALSNIAEMVEGRTQERMIEEGCMKPLMRLSDSPNAEIRREVARNFALFASKRDSHSTLIRIHAANKMMMFLKDTDEAARRYGVLGLGNLAVTRESHQELFDVGAIAILIDIVKDVEDVATKRAIAFTFNNIASNSMNHTVCERLGLTRSLILLLHDKDKDTNLQAILATRRLCESSKFRNQFVDLHGVPVLIEIGMEMEDIEMKREIAATMRNISLSVHGKIVIIREKGLRLLGEFMQSPDVEICHQATGVVANLAEATENQAIMVDEGIIQHLKYVGRSKSVDIQREACRAIANVSSEYTYAPIIVAAGALQSLVSSMGSPDYLCQRYAVMGVGNLACHPSNQKKIVQEGGLPLLLSLAKYENGDLESQRYAALALTNLSGNKANHQTLIQVHTLTLMNAFLAHQDIEIRNTAIFAIANFASNPINHQLIIKENILPKLIAFLSIHDTQAQYRAICALRGLSTDIQIRLDIIELQGIDAILPLTKSDDVEIQMESLACLCNLSLCGCIGDNPLSFMNQISIQNLITYLCSTDTTFRLFGAVTIGNIASNVTLQDSIISSGGLIPLISMANQADYETQRCIAYAIINLSADPKRRHDIVREGGLLSLISLACSDDLQDVLIALSAIRGIVSHSENRRAVYQCNLLEMITLAVRANSLEIRGEIASIMNALSINDENKLQMSTEDIILQNLIILLQENKSYIRILRPAMACLSNLSERVECHPFLRRHQIHNLILEYFYSAQIMDDFEEEAEGQEIEEDIGMLREVTRCLSNLSSIHENHPPIVSGGGIAAFIHTAKHRDALVSRFSTLGLMNLTTLPDNHAELVHDKAYEVLTDIVNQAKRMWYTLDPIGERIIRNTTEGVQKDDDEFLLQLSPREQSDYSFLTKYEYDLESCRYACLAVGNLAISFFTHGHLLNDGLIEGLNDALLSPDPETRFNAAYAFSKLSIQHDNIEYLGKQGIIPNLINLLTFENEFESKGQAVSALRHLAYHIENRMIMAQENSFFTLVISLIQSMKLMEQTQQTIDALSKNQLTDRILTKTTEKASVPVEETILLKTAIEFQQDHEEIYREVVALFTQLTLSDNIRSFIISYPELLQEISLLLTNKDIEISRFACSIMANLAEAKRTHKSLVSYGNLIHVMISLMRSKHAAIMREATRAMSNMMSSRASHVLFLQDNGLTSLFSVCRQSLDLETLHHASLIFRKLSPILTNHEAIVGKGGLIPLLVLINHHYVPIQVQAVATLRDLASNLNFKTVIAEEGGLKKAIALSKDENPLEVRAIAMGILRHLSVNTRIKKPILTEGALIPIYQAIDTDRSLATTKSSDVSVQDQEQDSASILSATSSLFTAEKKDKDNEAYSAEGKEDNLQLDLLKQTAAVLSNICENQENQILLIKEQVTPYLIFLTRSKDMEVQQDVSKTFALLTSNIENQINVFGYQEILAMITLLKQCIHDEENCQRDLLIALGNLAITYKNQQMIVELGVLSECYRLIQSEFETVQRYVIRLLYRLAANQHLQEDMLRSLASCFPLLNTLLYNPQNPLIQKYILMFYCNLASSLKNRQVMIKYDIIAPVLAQLTHDEEIISRYAAMIITNLATESNNQLYIAKLDGISALVLLASKENTEAAKFAGMALANLASNRLNRIPIVDALGLIPLMKMAQSKNIESQRVAALSFYNLSCAIRNHVSMVRANIMSSLSVLGGSSDLECKTFCIMAIANLTANAETRMLGTRSGSLQAAIGLLKDEDLNVRRYACIAVCNMANERVTQEQIIVHGALPSILAMAAGEMPPIQRTAQSKFSIKFQNMTHQEALQSQAAIVRSNKKGNNTNKGGKKNADVSKTDQHVTLNKNVNSSHVEDMSGKELDGEEEEEGFDPKDDLESRRLAFLALNNLASNELNHSSLINKGFLDLCIRTFSAITDLDIRTYAAFGVANLCSNPDYLALIGKSGAIPLLLFLSTSGNIHIVCLGLAGLRRLANNEDNWDLLFKSNIVDSLASAGKSSYLEIQCEVAATVCSLSLSKLTHHRIEIAYKCLEMLNSLINYSCDTLKELMNERPNLLEDLQARTKAEQDALSQKKLNSPKKMKNKGQEEENKSNNDQANAVQAVDGDDEEMILSEQITKHQYNEENSFHNRAHNYVDIARQCIGSIANLAEDIETHEYIAQSRAIRLMIPLISFQHIDIQREITRVMSNILTSFRHQSEIINQGIPALVNLAYSHDPEIAYHVAVSLRKLTPNIHAHAIIVYSGGFPALFHLLHQQENYLIQLQAGSALRDLVGNPDFRLKCAEENGIPVIISLIRQFANHEHLLAILLSALRHLSLETLLKYPIVKEGAMRPVLKTVAFNIDDVSLQVAGILANLSECYDNQVHMVEESVGLACLTLAFHKNDEIQQDISRTLANLSSNEELHVALYKQGIMNSLIHLTKSPMEITQKYAAMGLRFISCHPEIRQLIVKNKEELQIYQFMAMPNQSLEYRRTAATAFASFTLFEANKFLLIQSNSIPAMLSLMLAPTQIKNDITGQIKEVSDLSIQRDACFAIANLTDTQSIQSDLLREGVLKVLKELALITTDIRIQRDLARAYANLCQLEDTRIEVMNLQSLFSILTLAKSLDSACQRYATLALCNLSASALKYSLLSQGILKALIFLTKFPDPEIQRSASLAIAGLALGNSELQTPGTLPGNTNGLTVNNKVQIIQEGGTKALLDLMLFPDEVVQLCACLAINALTIGVDKLCKQAVLTENGVTIMLELLNTQHDRYFQTPSYSHTNNSFNTMNTVSNKPAPGYSTVARDLNNAIVYCLGSICEHDDVKLRFVELHGISSIVKVAYTGDMDMKRAVSYCLATISEQIEYHNDLETEGALPYIVSMASMEDLETQEYTAFSLAHLASNRDLQVKLVNYGVVKPLVTMLSSDAEPKHYAGLALLKLADNFENHLRIAQEGGIQALLRLGRTRTTDDQLQYKASLTLGQLASHAVKLMPNGKNTGGLGATLDSTANTTIAPISHAMMNTMTSTLNNTNPYNNKTGTLEATAASTSRVTSLRAQVNAQKKKAQDTTINFLDKSLLQTQQEQYMLSKSLDGGFATNGFNNAQTITQVALQIGNYGEEAPSTPIMEGKKGNKNAGNAMARSYSNDITPLHPSMLRYETTDEDPMAVTNKAN